VELLHRSAGAREEASQVARHITLNVVVTDASGKPMPGLPEKAFTVLDNQRPLKIASFQPVEGRTAKAPVHIIVVLDILNNSFQSIAYELRAIEKYLGRDRGQLTFPISIALLSKSGLDLGQSSRDGNVLIGQLRKLPYPGTPKEKRNIFATVVNLSDGFLEAQMTVDAISSSPDLMHDTELRRNYYKDFLNGVAAADQADPGYLALPVLALQSGGLVFEDNKDLAGKIARCVKDAESYYVLSFDSAQAAQDIEHRALQVSVDQPGVRVRTNASYYAQP
jgi:hypothetical protein